MHAFNILCCINLLLLITLIHDHEDRWGDHEDPSRGRGGRGGRGRGGRGGRGRGHFSTFRGMLDALCRNNIVSHMTKSNKLNVTIFNFRTVL